MGTQPSRRRFLQGAGAAGIIGIAGCAGGDEEATDVTSTDRPTSTEATERRTPAESGAAGPPTANRERHLAYSVSTLRESTDRGAGKDQIPSIDQPSFAPPDALTFPDEMLVFGVVRNGVARAYPQRLLVYHEIVNDRIDGEAATSLGYLLLYLGAIRDLGVVDQSRGIDVIVVADPLARAVQRVGYYQFEPIANLTLGPVSYLFAPGNVVIGLVIGGLVGVNLAVTLYTRRRPTACTTRAPAGAIAGIPALLSGSACCGPLILLVVGVQATATVLAAFRILLPATVVLLLLSLLYLGWQTDEATLEASTQSVPE